MFVANRLAERRVSYREQYLFLQIGRSTVYHRITKNARQQANVQSFRYMSGCTITISHFHVMSNRCRSYRCLWLRIAFKPKKTRINRKDSMSMNSFGRMVLLPLYIGCGNGGSGNVSREVYVRVPQSSDVVYSQTCSRQSRPSSKKSKDYLRKTRWLRKLNTVCAAIIPLELLT